MGSTMMREKKNKVSLLMNCRIRCEYLQELTNKLMQKFIRELISSNSAQI